LKFRNGKKATVEAFLAARRRNLRPHAILRVGQAGAHVR